MRLAVVQTNPVFGEVDKNVREAIGLMESAAADLYVLPELFNTGYNFADSGEASQLAEKPDGPTFKSLSKFASKNSCWIAYGFSERADKLYNSAALVGPAGLAGMYRKVHLFYREKLFFAPGDLGFPVFDLPFGKAGIMICFDWMFPESARSLAVKGAQLLLHPSNLVMPHCPDAMVTRCLENRVFAATANRIGTEDRGGRSFTYIGKSEIVTHQGNILRRMGEREPGIAVEEVDIRLASDKRINEFNSLLDDRRADQYSK